MIELNSNDQKGLQLIFFGNYGKSTLSTFYGHDCMLHALVNNFRSFLGGPLKRN